MNWLLERKLNKLGRRADPDPRFKGILEKHLKKEVGHPAWWIHTWKWVVSATTIAAIAGSGTAVYAYSSDAVLPSHPLYGIRTSIENVEESLAVKPEDKVNVKLKLIKRRMHEVELLLKNNKSVPPETEKEIESKMEQAVEASNELPEPTIDESEDTMSKEEELVNKVDETVEEAHSKKDSLKPESKKEEKDAKDESREED